MIALRQAFNIARQNSLRIKLNKIAYDLGDSWAFGYGGDEPINGFFPVIVNKNTGALADFAMPADFERMENAPRVKV